MDRAQALEAGGSPLSRGAKRGRKVPPGRVAVPLITVYADHLRLVPAQLFEQVQNTFQPDDKYGDLPLRYSAPNIKYLLIGIALCARCGSDLKLTQSYNGIRRFGCKHKSNTCNHTFNMEVVESMVLRGLQDLVLSPLCLEDYEKVAKESIREREDREREIRVRLEKQADALRDTLNNAIRQTFTSKRLNERREAMLAEMEDKLEVLEDRINSLLRVRAAELSPDALPSLRNMFDELAARAPFLPKNAEEIAVVATLRKLISTVRVSRRSDKVIEAEVEYDLGPVLGLEASSTVVTKTLIFNKAEYRQKVEKRGLQAEQVLAQGGFPLSDEDFEILSGSPTFRRLFGHHEVEMRRNLVQALLFKGAFMARIPMLRRILGSDSKGLRVDLRKFRMSDCLPSFVEAANMIFPDLPINRAVYKPFHRERSTIRNELVAGEHPFVKLRMCRSDSGQNGISDAHWDIIQKLPLGYSKHAKTVGPDYVAEVKQKTRLMMEALALMVRDDVPIEAAAEATGQKRQGIATNYLVLRRNGHFLEISRRILELEANDPTSAMAAD